MQELLDRKKGLHRRILIVDDEFIEREMLGNMLSSAYEVVYAGDGAAALDMIKKDKSKLSLIILDLHMPKLDGYSLLEKKTVHGTYITLTYIYAIHITHQIPPALRRRDREL